MLLKPAEHVFWKVAVQIYWWHCFQRIMGQIVINMLSIWWQTYNTVIPNYVQQDYKSPKNKFLSNLHPPKARQLFKTGNNCMACLLSVHLRSLSLPLVLLFQLYPWFSLIFLFCPLLHLSTPPLNRTIFSACYRAWSIPCYHREINYLDQAAEERGNNERMLLLRRR